MKLTVCRPHSGSGKWLCLLALAVVVGGPFAAGDTPATGKLPPAMPDTRPTRAQIDQLVTRLTAGSATDRGAAAAGLQRLGIDAAPARSALQRAIDDPAPSVQVAAADAWAASWGRDAQAVAGLLPALADKRPVLRSAVIMQLTFVDPKQSTRILPALVPLLDDTDETTRAKAASAIGTLAEHAPDEAAKAVAPLVKALTDSKDKLTWEKRFDAARTLLRIGPAARSAAPQVMAAIRSAETIPYLRDRLIPLLPRIVEKPADLVPLLTELKQDKDADVAAAAEKLLSQIK